MCGIAGFLDSAGVVSDAEATLRSMAATLRHRGPDDEGVAWIPSPRVGFAFRRLAIQDRSPLGHQPMSSASGRYTIVFNGEVYNFGELRRECGQAPRGGSDTEVMLALFERFGIRASIDRFVGMFAFAVWDAQERELTLVRDRLGVKPLYVGLTGDGNGDAALGGATPAGRSLVFASELKALRPMPAMRFDVDEGALALFLRHSYVPAPWTIHRSVRKLPPGHLLRVRDGRCTLERYWSSKDLVDRGPTFTGSEAEAAERASSLIDEAVRQRMIADVPVGAFLSGGVDSSAVVAAMTAVSSDVRTFTIAMEDPRYDEARKANAVARHLHARHTAITFSANDALALVPTLPDIWDEPFADSSQLATHLVAKLAREHVTVALTGDGGDEVFGGYERYRLVPGLWRRIASLPVPMRSAAAAALAPMSGALGRLFGDRGHKLGPILGSSDAWEMFHRLTSVVQAPSALLLASAEPRSPLTDGNWLTDSDDLVRRMMQADLVSYLPDDILVKVDRASMAVGLEAREPLLDHRLVEFALSVPTSMLVREGTSKRLLREVLARRVPRSLTDGAKRGFAVPLHGWLSGPLREWAEALLDERRLREGGRFRVDSVRTLWASLLRGRRVEHQVWNVLMFRAWEERWG